MLNAQREGRGQSAQAGTARRVPAPRRDDRTSGEELAAAGGVSGRRGGRGRCFRECSWPAKGTGNGTDPVQGGERARLPSTEQTVRWEGGSPHVQEASVLLPENSGIAAKGKASGVDLGTLEAQT